ncbi:unnamed protein product [Angiostrongylus costaricensis]|uniref:Transcription initiation factor TFIID subunit 6 n=1 Tax=Angiostrongylus costaricensis TaxID=334426 RepID=A0A0R3Q1K5_ANGCS|nr:unnamed protein product [Angiostrongylus costaricensis]
MIGRELSPQAQRAIVSYSDDLLEALIDAVCLETKSQNSHRIREEDVLKSVKAVSLFPLRVVPRATLKIFNPKASPHQPAVPRAKVDASQAGQVAKKPGQPFIRPRRVVVDEAQFLEDIRKMKPTEIKEPVLYSSHKLTLEVRDLRPLLGASAVAEASTALERPARHFVGRPQPLITEDRGNLQPELTTYHKYREYLGIVGPLPNIKSKFGPMTEIPAYLHALQQRNEILGLAANNGTAMPNIPQVHRPNIPIQQLSQVTPLQMYYEQPYPRHQASLNFPFQYLPQFPLPPQPNVSIPFDIQQAFQTMHPHETARIFHEFLQRQRRQKWVDDLERSALISPTPPLTECEYPLCSIGGHHHCVSSRRSADLTLSLTIRADEMASSTPPCTREDTPPEPDIIEFPEGPVDHIDCAGYYTRINSGPFVKNRDSELPSPSEARKKLELDLRQDADVVADNTNASNKIFVPKPPTNLSPKEALLYEKCVGRLMVIAHGGKLYTS